MEAIEVEKINLKSKLDEIKAKATALFTQGLLDNDNHSTVQVMISELEAHQQIIELEEKRKIENYVHYTPAEVRQQQEEDNQNSIKRIVKVIEDVFQEAEKKSVELAQRQNLVATCMTQVCASSHIFKALQHFHLGNYRRAISAAQKSINAGEETNLAYKIMAMCHFKKNDGARELIARQNYSEINPITDERLLNFQEEVSVKLLHNKIKNDLEIALKYLRKKKYVKAIAAANDCIDKGIDTHFAHLLVALSLYHAKPKDQENLKEVLTHLYHAKNFLASRTALSTREAFAKEWAECLFNSFSLQVSDVVQLIQKGLNSNLDEQEKTQTREKLRGLIEFDDANNTIKLKKEQLGAYTTYQILKGLREQKVITTGKEYVRQLKELGVTKADDADLHRKIKRKIDQHDSLHPIKRAAARGAQSARQFLKAAGDKRFVSAALKFADEYRRAKISGPIDVVFHLLPHVVPLIFSAIGYAATAIFTGIRWLLSPIIGAVIVEKEEKAVDKKAVELPVKLFKYEHVGKGAGLAFFAAVTPPRSEQLMNLELQQPLAKVK